MAQHGVEDANAPMVHARETYGFLRHGDDFSGR